MEQFHFYQDFTGNLVFSSLINCNYYNAFITQNIKEYISVICANKILNRIFDLEKKNPVAFLFHWWYLFSFLIFLIRLI